MANHPSFFQNGSSAPGDEPSPRPESAPLGPRAAAFGADVLGILVLFFAANLVLFSQNTEVVEELERYTEEMREYQERRQAANGAEEDFGPPPVPSQEAQRLIQITYMVTLALILLYFVLGEVLTGGASPGKRLFRLRVVRTDPGAGTNLALGATVIRSLIKAVSFALAMSLHPIMMLFLVNYLFAFFTRDRRAIHDYLARTAVVAIPQAPRHDTPEPPQDSPA